MTDINFNGYTIKLKHIPNQSRWLTLIYDSKNEIVASDYLRTKEDGEKWAKNTIKNNRFQSKKYYPQSPIVDIEYLGFTIKINYSMRYTEWLVTIKDTNDETLVINRLSSLEDAKEWAKSIIKNISSNYIN